MPMGMTATKSVAAEIRAALARKQMRHGALAKRLGISPSALSMRLNGRQDITVEEMVRIAEILDADPIEWMRSGVTPDLIAEAADLASAS